MYKSPVELYVHDIKQQMTEKLEETCYTAVIEYFPNVDKDELIRALRYDRQQYEQGYADGKRDAVVHSHWVSAYEYDFGAGVERKTGYNCGRCGLYYIKKHNYCPDCGACMDAEATE